MSRRWLRQISSRLGLTRNRQPIRRRLQVESLEDRRVMSGVNDDFGDSFASAFVLDLSSSGEFSLNARLNAANDVDVIRVRTTGGQPQSIRVLNNPFASSEVPDYKLEAFDLHGTLLASNDNSAGTTDPSLTLESNAPNEYFLRVSAKSPTFASPQFYGLRIMPYVDDLPSDRLLVPIRTIANGPMNLSGRIEVVGDADTFRFQVTQATGLAFTLNAVPNTPFDANLIVRDSAGVVVAQSDNVSTSDLKAQVSIMARPGEVYTVTATASPFTIPSGATGAYTLSATPFVDEAGETPAQAGTINLDASGSGAANGVLGLSADRDGYRFTVERDGIYRVVGTTTQGAIPTVRLTRLDGTPVGTRFGSDVVRFEAVEGDTFLATIETTSAGGSAYRLAVAPLPQDGNNTNDSATPVVQGQNRSGTIHGFIGVAGDFDIYRLRPTDGGAITLTNATNVLATTQFEITNAQGVPLTSGLGTVSFPVAPDEDYFIRVTATDRFQGAYSVSIAQLVDQIGSTPAGAMPLTITAGAAAFTSRIEFSGDLDLFEFVPLATGRHVIRLETINGLEGVSDPILTVFAADGRTQIARNDDADGLNSRLSLDLVAGTTYFLRAEGFSNRTGDYRLSVVLSPTAANSPDQIGNVPDSSAPTLTLSPGTESTFIRTDEIQTNDSGDVFQFVAPTSSVYRIRLEGAVDSGNPLRDPFLILFDSTGTEIARNDDADGLNSRLDRQLIAGQTYFVRARGFNTSTGFYRLTIADTAARPMSLTGTPIQLDALGNGSATGTLVNPGDTVNFMVTSAFTGSVVVDQVASGSSRLDSLLSVLDELGNVVQRDDDSGDGANSRLTLEVMAGRQYLIRAGGFSTSTGAFSLRFTPITPDDFDDERAKATLRQLVVGGDTVIQGVIEEAGDLDWFSFVAPRTESLELVQQARGNSSLDSLLQVEGFLNGSQSVLVNDDFEGSLNSALTFRVTQGQTYFVRAGAFSQSVGAYEVIVRSVDDDFGDTPETSQRLTFDPVTQSATISGSLRIGDDEDVFNFVAPTTASYSVRVANMGRSDILLDANQIDAEGDFIQTGPFTSNNNGFLAFSAQAGETVFFKVLRFEDGPALSAVDSAYRIFVTQYVDDVPNQFIDPGVVQLAENGYAERTGRIEITDDEDLYVFVAPFTGSIDVRMTGTSDSLLDSNLTAGAVLDGETVDNDDADGQRTIDSQLTLEVVAGRAYFVRAGASINTPDESKTGGYRLLFQRSRSVAELTPDFIAATELPVDPSGRGQIDGALTAAGDTASYRFTASETGIFTASVTRTGTTLDAVLSLYRVEASSSGFAFVDRNQNRTPGDLNPEITFNALQGEEYILLVDSTFGEASRRLGGFRLSLNPTASFPDEAGSDFLDAAPIGLIDDEARFSGSISTPFDVDRYFLTPALDGEFLLYLDGVTTLSSFVELLQGETVLSPDSTRSTFAPIYSLEGGVRYDIRVRGGDPNSPLDQPRTPGAYSLVFRPDFDDAFISDGLRLNANGSGTVTGFVEVGGDSDFYEYVAPADGQIQIDLNRVGLTGNTFDPFLRIFNGAGQRIAQNDDFAPPNRDSRVLLEVQEGETYFFGAGGFEVSTGLYQLSVSAPGGNTFADANSIVLTSRPRTISGEINSSDDVDTYRLIAPATGTLRIDLTGAEFDSFLLVSRIFANGDVIEGVDGDTSSDTTLELNVTEGEEIVLRAENFIPIDRTDYSLELSYTNLAETISSRSSTTRMVDLNGIAGVTRFPVVTGLDGVLSVIVDPIISSGGSFVVRALDADLNVIAQNSADIVERGTKIQFNVRAGEATFIEIESLNSGSNSRNLFSVRYLFAPNATVTTTVPNRIQPISLATASSESIPFAGTTQVRSFQATSTGLTALEFNAPTALQVGVWDSRNQLLDSSVTASAQLTFQAVDGETYFLRISSPDDAAPLAGTYSLQLLPDDEVSPTVPPMDVTRPIQPPAASFNGPNDRDRFNFTAPTAGMVTLRFSPAPGVEIDPTISVSSGGFNTVGGRSVTFGVAAGTDFTAILNGSRLNDDKSGRQVDKYELQVDFVANVETGNDPDQVGGPGDDSPTGTAPGRVAPPGDPGANGPFNSPGAGGGNFNGGNQGGDGTPGFPLTGNLNDFATVSLPSLQSDSATSLAFGVTTDAEGLLLLTLFGFDAEAEFPADPTDGENGDAIDADAQIDDEILQRLNAVADSGESFGSLRARFDQVLQRLVRAGKAGKVSLEMLAELDTPQFQENVANVRYFLAEVDKVRQSLPGIDTAIGRISEMLLKVFGPSNAPNGKPKVEPNLLDEFLTPEPGKLFSRLQETTTDVVADDRVRLLTPTSIATLLLGIVALRADRETLWRSLSGASSREAAKKKRPAPPESR